MMWKHIKLSIGVYGHMPRDDRASWIVYSTEREYITVHGLNNVVDRLKCESTSR
jgi:hypothetical protein